MNLIRFCSLTICFYSSWALPNVFNFFDHIDKIVKFDPRIIGGTPAKIGEFRGQVSLQDRFNSHVCAGVLLDPLHIVTAGHCYQGRKPIGYVMADDIMVSIKGSDTRQIRKVIHFVPHPTFIERTMQNDIAVIRVDEPFKVTETSGPMRRSTKSPEPGTNCTVIGWGYTINGEENISYELLKTNVYVEDIAFCNSSYAMKPGMFCAGRKKEGGHDACKGDSGGLLTCAESNEITGIVSFGTKCGLPRFPGVYTDVSMYKEWIDEIMSSEKLPDYDFSPFPNPTERIVGTGNSERLKNTALIILLPSMFHCIMAFW